MRRFLLLAGFAGLGLLLLSLISVMLQRDLPPPTGPLPVGRTAQIWVDTARPELLSEKTDDYRQVPVQIWYPADAGPAAKGAYFPNLDRMASSLAASGEVSSLEAYALRLIRSHARLGAAVAGASPAYPVIILSPGNGTNIEFYAGIADELASHGYVVAGLNHPYDVAAVALQDGSNALFAPGPLEFAANQAWVGERVAVRTQDILFALGQLEKLNADAAGLFAGRLDLAQVAVMGHSLGGIAAAQACRAEARFRSCLNLDGLQRGGPFATSENPALPDQPFMMITKEKQLPPASLALFEAIPSGSYRVVIDGASHDSFTDGPALMPSLLPLPNQADQILSLVRKYTLAFFDQTLKGEPSALLGQSLPGKPVTLEVYPPS